MCRHPRAIRKSALLAGAFPLLSVFCAPLAAQFAQIAIADDPHYYLFDQRIDLELDRSRLALLGPGGEAAPGSDPAIAKPAKTPVEIEPWPMDGWSIASADRPLTDAELDDLTGKLLESHLFVSPIYRGLDGGVLFATQRVLVQFAEDVGRAEALRVMHRLDPGAVVEEQWGGLRGAYRLTTTSALGRETLDIANALARRADTTFAEPEMIFTGRPTLIPNDPGFINLWGMLNAGHAGGVQGMDMKATYAWDLTIGEDSIHVMVIDVGVDPIHADLNQVTGADFTGQGGAGAPVNECDNHGTPVAGCVSAIINNNLGTVGMAPGCPVVSARCLISLPICNGAWTSNSSWTVEALNWAETHGVRVTNNSNEYGFMSSAIAQRYATTRDGGIIHFASSGNDNLRALSYPGSLPSVMSIGAIGRSGEKASFSNYHAELDLVAPGRDIYTTDRTGALGWSTNDYTFTFGTSLSAPYAAGVAALVLSVNPALMPPDVEHILESTARDLGEAGKDELFGYGLVNAFKAVMEAQTCYADCDGDAQLDIFDFLCYQDHFLSGNAYADCDTNGEINILDYTCFADRFVAGCP